MALVNVADREIHGKVVYHGPALGGKTTNLTYLQAHLSGATSGDPLPMEIASVAEIGAAATEPMCSFDFLPLHGGKAHGFMIRFHLYAVPSEDLYRGTRGAVLNGADGAVFVADAQRDRLQDNLNSLRELAQNVSSQNKRFRDFPLVMQYNKMDLLDVLPVAVLDRYLNPDRLPRFKAEAINGVGVLETLEEIARLITNDL